MSFKFNPVTGKLDLVINSEVVDNKITKVAAETISALKVVRSINTTDIALADPATYPSSKAIAISIQSGSVGDELEIVVGGEILDPSFSFLLNEPIFLGPNGTILQNPPVSGQVLNIGHGLGPGGIFLDIKEQIELC